jgi:hypothetical protein
MTSSHVIALVAFGTMALFGLLAWVVSFKHPRVVRDPVMRRKARLWALLFPVIGMVMGFGAFTLNNRVARTTLYEVVTEGSVGVEPGTSAPVRNLVFNVEHPGVEHDLMISPTSKLFQTPSSEVEVAFSLHGPTEEVLIPERTEHFRVEGGGRRKRDWEAKNFNFTPVVAGSHTLQVVPITIGIPSIHIHIEDPLKRDGKRAAGY